MTQTPEAAGQDKKRESHTSGGPTTPPQRPSPPEHLWYRRNLFSVAGFWGLSAFLGANVLGFLRFMFPRVLFEPATVFKAGRPERYAVGEVNTRFVASQGVWVVRGARGFFALHAKCTHLGCTPRWLEAEQKFKCPCHGSGFAKDGVNFEGPAPTPLRRLRIKLADDGQLLIDQSRKFRQERGEWDDPEAFLRV